MHPGECSRISDAAVNQMVSLLAAFTRKAALALRDCKGQDGCIPAPYDPTALLECFPHLRLREGFRLVSY
jgi:hypothetical protein